MGRIAAALALLVLSASAARAEGFAEDFVTAFRLICLSDKPYEEAFQAAVRSGRLRKPLVVLGGDGSASTRMRPRPEGYPGDQNIEEEVPAYSVGFYKQLDHVAGGNSCHVGTLGKVDDTGMLRPLVDKLPELAQPAGTMSTEERRRFGREGPRATDPAWHVVGSPDSVVVLYYSEHMWGGTSLVRIEPPTH